MPTTSVTTAIRDRSTRYGILTVLAGLALLVGLRFWTSPLARRIVGWSGNGLVEFLMIPLFFVLVAVGVLLFLWEPDAE